MASCPKCGARAKKRVGKPPACRRHGPVRKPPQAPMNEAQAIVDRAIQLRSLAIIEAMYV